MHNTIMSQISDITNTGMVNYVSFCLIFFVLKFRYFPDDKYIWIGVFFAFCCILQFVNNLYLTKIVCGEPQANQALFATLMPWIVVFGTVVICLFLFKGWLRVFSNTFGMTAAQMYGINEVVQQIFSKDQRNAVTEKANNPVNINLLKAIENVYSSPSIIVNELDPSDAIITPKKDSSGNIIKPEEGGKQQMDISWNSMNLLFNGILDKTNLTDKNLILELHNKVLLKDTVGYFVWFILMGSLTILISTNTLINNGCSTETGLYDSVFKESIK